MRMRKKVDVGRGRTDGDGRTRGTGEEIPVMGEEGRGKEGRLLWPEGRETEEERGGGRLERRGNIIMHQMRRGRRGGREGGRRRRGCSH